MFHVIIEIQWINLLALILILIKLINNKIAVIPKMSKHRRYLTQPSQQQVALSTNTASKNSDKKVNPLFFKQSMNFYKKASNITLPIQSEQKQQFSQSQKAIKLKAYPDRLIPPRNNLRCLNDFLKQQALFIRSKERIVSNLSNEQISNSALGNMKERIKNMIKFQATKPQILFKENQLECFNDVLIVNFQLNCQQSEENDLKGKQNKMKIHSSIVKCPNDAKTNQRKQGSLTPLLRFPSISRKESCQRLSKLQKIKSKSVRSTALRKKLKSFKTNEENNESCSKVNLTIDHLK